MSDNLCVAVIQTNLLWEKVDDNLMNFETLIFKIVDKVDLIVLPEMFSTGFTMNPQNIAETMQGKTIFWMKSIAKQKNCALIGSLVIEENRKFYNRCVFAFPDGNIEFYDKRHLFTLSGENNVYSSQSNRVIVNFKGWKIYPLICYDLRFPVWSRNTEDYDLLIYVANWPKPRINAWDILLKARAIENMSYTIGVNRIGYDKNGYEYSGHSAILDFMGATMSHLSSNTEGILITDFSKTKQEEVRKKLNFLNDRDFFTIQDS